MIDDNRSGFQLIVAPRKKSPIKVLGGCWHYFSYMFLMLLLLNMTSELRSRKFVTNDLPEVFPDMDVIYSISIVLFLVDNYFFQQ